MERILRLANVFVPFAFKHLERRIAAEIIDDDNFVQLPLFLFDQLGIGRLFDGEGLFRIDGIDHVVEDSGGDFDCGFAPSPIDVMVYVQRIAVGGVK